MYNYVFSTYLHDYACVECFRGCLWVL